LPDPATDGKGNETPEFKPYLDFVDDFIACWLKGAKGGEVLYACPEFGPVISGYGISTFPNVWKDAVSYAQKRRHSGRRISSVEEIEHFNLSCTA